MSKTAPPTAPTADDDHEIARELVAQWMGARPVRHVELDRLTRLIAETITAARAAGHAAGVESCQGAADDAHATGYREALERVVHELSWPDPRGHWRAADEVRAMLGDTSVTAP